jgi:hypothetical protein
MSNPREESVADKDPSSFDFGPPPNRVEIIREKWKPTFRAWLIGGVVVFILGAGAIALSRYVESLFETRHAETLRKLHADREAAAKKSLQFDPVGAYAQQVELGALAIEAAKASYERKKRIAAEFWYGGFAGIAAGFGLIGTYYLKRARAAINSTPPTA